MRRETFDEFDEFDEIDEEAVIEQVLGESLRANELRLLRQTLEQRREVLRRDLAQATEAKERERYSARLREIAKQIAALKEEEAVTEFVERSVRFTLHKPDAEA
jgi:hypothetical protein